MDRYEEENTISLWEDDSPKKIVLTNLHSGEKISFILKKNCIVGRRKPPCDIQITTKDRYISGEHFCFEKKGSSIYIRDLNSKNGTWLNGKKILSSTCVHQEDVLKAGRSEFKIHLG